MIKDEVPAATTDQDESDREPTNGRTIPIATENRREATVMELARVIADSRDFPSCRSPEKAAVRILAGKELGIGPIASVMGIRIEAGRVSMDACLMAGMIERSGTYDFREKERDAEHCVLEFLRDGQVRGEARFTAEEAQKAGLLKKDVWRAYQRDMVYWRAVSRGARQYCAGLFGSGVYVHEELGLPVDAEGRILDKDADDTDGGTTAPGSELCTRQQRQQIAQLIEAAGGNLPEVLGQLGIRMLDELSGYEAAKLIKKWERKGAKEAGTKPAAQLNDEGQAAPGAAEPVKEIKEAPAPRLEPPKSVEPGQMPPESDSGKDLAAGKAEAAKSCTRSQQMEIKQLAEQLEPNEEARYEMFMGPGGILQKRGKTKIAQLDALAAHGVIDGMRRMLKERAAETEAPLASNAATSP